MDQHTGTSVTVWEDPASGNYLVLDETLSPQDVMTAARMAHETGGADPQLANVMKVIDGAWGSHGRGGSNRLGGVLDRDAFVAPTGTMNEIRLARKALKDDVIGNGADITEAFALSAVKMFTPDLDEEDCWNQWAGVFDLDSVNRRLWRRLYSDSQFAAVTWWDRRTFKVRGKTDESEDDEGNRKGGRARRKTFDIVCPVALSTLDTTRVVPVGTMMFGQEQLAYVAEPAEAARFDAILARREGSPVPEQSYLPVEAGERMLANATGGGIDPVDTIVKRLIRRRYTPSRAEAKKLRDAGVPNTRHLFLLDQRFAFRHTLTKADDEMFAEVRLASLFDLLDRKQQLQQMDRAFLVGGTNYIIVITKGSDKEPAHPDELRHLRANAHRIGQFPLITGDHRLHVEIVTPKIDFALDEKKYDTIDKRINARVFGTFTTTGSSAGGDPLDLGRVIGTGLESRRRMLRRSLEANVTNIMRLSNPTQLRGRAKMIFSPDKISLAFDSAWATFITGLLDSKHISRQTALSQFGLDQADEAVWREREHDIYDDTFQSIVPFAEAGPGADPISPAERQAQAKKGGARAGGLKGGGGRAPGTQQGKESIDPKRSQTGPTRKPKAVAATADEVIEAIEGGIADGALVDLLNGTDDRKRPHRDALKDVAGYFEVPGRHQMTVGTLISEILDAYDTQLEAHEP